jgi:glycerol-3-phosphate acyltransferase PlsY
MPGNDTHYIGYVAGLFAIIGHVFPLYYGFKGGKGVLVSAATFISIDYKVFIALFSIFLVVLVISKYVSLSSIIGTSYCPLATFLMSWLVDGYTVGRSLLYAAMSIPMVALVIWMHRTNIQRLKDGNENKFTFKPIKMGKE